MSTVFSFNSYECIIPLNYKKHNYLKQAQLILIDWDQAERPSMGQFVAASYIHAKQWTVKQPTSKHCWKKSSDLKICIKQFQN